MRVCVWVCEVSVSLCLIVGVCYCVRVSLSVRIYDWVCLWVSECFRCDVSTINRLIFNEVCGKYHGYLATEVRYD